MGYQTASVAPYALQDVSHRNLDRELDETKKYRKQSSVVVSYLHWKPIPLRVTRDNCHVPSSSRHVHTILRWRSPLASGSCLLGNLPSSILVLSQVTS
jgi:hypothetical protein